MIKVTSFFSHESFCNFSCIKYFLENLKDPGIIIFSSGMRHGANDAQFARHLSARFYELPVVFVHDFPRNSFFENNLVEGVKEELSFHPTQDCL